MRAQRIPRRLRVPARRVAGIDADALSPQRLGSRAQDCRPAASTASRTAIAAVSGSRATTTKRFITGRSPRTTTRRRRETASPRRRCLRWDIWRRSRVTSRPLSARCGCSRTDSPNPRRRSRRCWWRSTDCTRRPPHSSLAAIRQRRAIGSDIWSISTGRSSRSSSAVGEAVPEALRKGTVRGAGAAAWLCQGMQCLPAVTDLQTLEAQLASSVSTAAALVSGAGARDG